MKEFLTPRRRMALTLHLIEQAALNFLNHQTTPVTLYQYLDNIGILDIGKKLILNIPTVIP